MFKNVGKSSVAKIYYYKYLSIAGKIFEKIIKKRSLDQLEKHGLFLTISKEQFRYSRSAVDLMIFEADSISRGFDIVIQYVAVNV